MKLTWGNWILALVLIVLIYFALSLINSLFNRLKFFGKTQVWVQEILQKILTFYELISAIILSIIFIFINPYVHGLMVFVILLLGYIPIKHYIIGRLFLSMQNLKKKQHIKVANTSGVIQKTGRMGINMLTQDGSKFINYSSLLSEGYVLLKGKKTGGLHQLLLRPIKEDKTNHSQAIIDKLIFCPYIDWRLKPEIALKPESTEQQYTLQVLVRKDNHLQSLTQLIKEWGYDCTRLK